MWLWQQNKAKLSLVMRIASISLAAHSCAIALLFFICGHASLSLKIGSRTVPPGQRIIVLPFYRNNMATQQRTITKKLAAQSPARQIKSITQKAVQKSTRVPTTSTTKKNGAKTETASKKIKATKQVTKAIKKEPVKEKKQPAPVAKKKIAKPNPDPLPEVIDHMPATPLVAQASAQEPITDKATDAPIVMGQDEYDAFTMHEQIRDEIARCWSPPAGIASGTNCIVTVYVTWQGGLERYTIQQPSGVLMFDMSVRVSLKNIAFPRCAHGKEITITFMQEN